MTKKEYDVAFSFAGEDRKYVEEVALLLQHKKIKIFYDEFYKAKLWGKNLQDFFYDLYKNKAQYVVIFISRHYLKEWSNVERQAMLDRARSNTAQQEYILPVRFDSTEIPGLSSSICYIDANKTTPTELFNLIWEKLPNPTNVHTVESSSSKEIIKTSEKNNEFFSSFPTIGIMACIAAIMASKRK